MIKEFLMVFTIIIIHELGHFLMAKNFKWNFDKIAIYPFGGCTKFNEKINKSLKEELLILINGPLFQILLYIIVIILNTKGIITPRSFNIFKNYHYTLLIFNLLPIYPLDGGRIFNIIMNYLLPYKKGNKIVILISIILTLTLILLYNSLNCILMSILLITEIIIYLKRQNYLYNKMLLERYITPPNYHKLKIIKNKNSLYKEKKHIIKYQNKYITEKDYLNKRFGVNK